MNYWLVKSEFAVYSFEQLIKDKSTCWDGVRNYASRNNLRDMKKGDQVFFYHSNEGTEIVGIAEVSKEAYQDPATPDANWVAVDLKPVKKLKNPVKLSEVKKQKDLAKMDLVRISRLSVQKVQADEWNKIIAMSNT